MTYFNPRSPHGERRLLWKHWEEFNGISIHAPRMGSDKDVVKREIQALTFQSTLPAWGATVQPKHTAMTA